MPICPKCGKHLTSEQALTYHLNRKYKCGSWKCCKCALVCKTKLDLQMHEMHCDVTRDEPSHEILKKIYTHTPGILLTSGSDILGMSPNTREAFGFGNDDLTSMDQIHARNNLHICSLDRSVCILSKL